MSKPAYWYIGAKAAQTSYYAETQARRLGVPLTHMATINFASTALNPRQAVGCFSKIRRHHFNKWAARPRKGAGDAFTPTYAYAFENVRDKVPFLTMEPGEPHNVHVHWALHLPAARAHDFEHHLWQWVDAATGGITGGSETIKIVPITLTLGGYLVKGTTPASAQKYARGRAAEPQGVIFGRRADTSRNLGPTARRALDRAMGIRRQMPSFRDQSPGGIRP